MCRLATQEMYFESHLDTRTILAHIDAVELDHMAAFTRDYLSRQFSKAHLAVTGPITDEPALRSQLTRLMSELAWPKGAAADRGFTKEPDNELGAAACFSTAAGFGESDAQ
jgi:hypothetical protein